MKALQIRINDKPAYGLMIRNKAKRISYEYALKFCFFIEKNRWPQGDEWTHQLDGIR